MYDKQESILTDPQLPQAPRKKETTRLRAHTPRPRPNRKVPALQRILRTLTTASLLTLLTVALAAPAQAAPGGGDGGGLLGSLPILGGLL